jgi:hypothetical protein
VVKPILRGYLMKGKKAETTRMKAQHASSVRASINFPSALYETLEGIAQQKKVSLAWVVRDAAEIYVVNQLTKQE